MSGQPTSDPSAESLWRPLRLLLARMDSELAEIYREAGMAGMKPSYVLELLRLDGAGPMTITELSHAVERTHSATSQKVSAMRRAGLVRTRPGPDARSKRVALTSKAKGIVPRLGAEWRATEAALAELEAELPYPLSTAVRDIEKALHGRSISERIKEKLRADPAWQ